MKPKLIVLEGPDNVGKSTQRDELVRIYNAEIIQQPSADNQLGFLRHQVKDHSKEYGDFGTQCLHTMSHMVDVTKLHLNEDKNFIMDRSHISTLVYGNVKGLSEVQNQVLLEVHQAMYKPVMDKYDVFIIFMDRSERYEKKETDEFEKTFKWSELRKLYVQAYKLSARVKWFNLAETVEIIECQSIPEDITAAITHIVDKREDS